MVNYREKYRETEFLGSHVSDDLIYVESRGVFISDQMKRYGLLYNLAMDWTVDTSSRRALLRLLKVIGCS
jgi:hypothetical protein